MRSRYDRRFYAVGAAVLAVAVLGKLLGADDFVEYPAIEVGGGPATLFVSVVVPIAGFAPHRRRPSPAISRSRSSRTPADPVSASEGI